MRVTSGGNGLRHESKTITFDGQAGTGAEGAVPVFTVTGEVLVSVLVPFCTTLLEDASSGTLALGVTGNTTLFIAATNAADIDANDFWCDTTPDTNGMAVPAALKDVAITDNIIGTVATDTIDSGAIRFDLWWLPLSINGNVA